MFISSPGKVLKKEQIMDILYIHMFIYAEF